MDAIMNRRSIRKFLDRPVPDDIQERLLRAAMQSPTGCDAQDWEFLVITDPDTRAAVSQASPYTVCARNAPLLILPLVNLNRIAEDSLLWTCDLSAACQTLLIAAEAEGLGAVWLAAYPHTERVEHLTKLFALPDNIVPFAVIAIGYKAQEKAFVDRYDPEKIHRERF